MTTLLCVTLRQTQFCHHLANGIASVKDPVRHARDVRNVGYGLVEGLAFLMALLFEKGNRSRRDWNHRELSHRLVALRKVLLERGEAVRCFWV
jgi:hypothetical protein